MKRVALVATATAAQVLLVATAAVAQQPADGQLPSETACNAVLERVQLALVQADRGLQAENPADVELWSSVAANYAAVHAAFCDVDGEG